MTFVYRGPNTFHFKRKRYPISSLKCEMACKRTISPGGGGAWDGKTGDGEAWHKRGDRYGPWMRVRLIKAGQWNGGWRLKNWRLTSAFPADADENEHHRLWRADNLRQPHPEEYGCQECVDPAFCCLNGDCTDLWVIMQDDALWG